MGNTDNYQVSVCFPFVWGGGLRILEALGFDAPSGVMTQGSSILGLLQRVSDLRGQQTEILAEAGWLRDHNVAWQNVLIFLEKHEILWQFGAWCWLWTACCACGAVSKWILKNMKNHGTAFWRRLWAWGFEHFHVSQKKAETCGSPKPWNLHEKQAFTPLWKSSDREADARQCGCYRPASLGYLWPCLQEAAGTVDTSRVETVLMWKWLHLSILFLIYAVQIVNS